jgi:hypothetical protein
MSPCGAAEPRCRGAGDPLRPEGRPLYAGLLGLAPPILLGMVWRLADRLREYRGDAYTASWTAAGFDGAEIGLLTELSWGLPARSYIRTRAWSDTDLDAAEARLRDRGLLNGGALTEQGRAAREEIEHPVVGRDQAAWRLPRLGPHDLAG